MNTLKISNYAKQGYSFIFFIFLFFSAIFCTSTRTNNLFHISLVLLLISLVSREHRKTLTTNIRQQWPTYILLVIFFVYYALSNIWGNSLQHFDSTLTHGTYIIIYLLLLTLMLYSPKTRYLTLLSIIGGVTVLSIWTLVIDHTLVLTTRIVSPENPGPTNVIDLAGYCGIGILLCCMLIREKKSYFLYLPIIIMLVMMAFTQSRGPIIALLLAFLCTLHLHVFTRRNMAITAVLVIILGLIFFFTPVGNMLLSRFEELGTQSGLRINIWHHTLAEVSGQLWLGRGFNYALDFINYSGEHITTTHSIYFGALLKGGVIGLGLLLSVIISGLLQTWCKRHNDSRYSLAIFIYSLIFISSEGMFIIGNPGVSWIMFWLPLGIALSKQIDSKR